MATDFFESQEQARRRTGHLVVLFGLAVVSMMACVYVIAVALLGSVGSGASGGSSSQGIAWWNPDVFLGVLLGVGAIVGGGSLYKIAQLKGGGRVVAEELGGQRLRSDTTDPKERRLLHVVEEMAIASGTPVPPIYLLDQEAGINAFAAGFSPSDAVVGVTRGAIENLDRDELQGVIAHEFSHILNGDMRLNIRLMGVLHGILVLGLLGYFLLRSSIFTRGSRSNRDQLGMVLLGLGAGLVGVGFLGTFFGNWIKASVSRQREYLADASAVQFTRNPSGIASALKRIGGFGEGSKMASPNAPEASHLFFGPALRHSIFATHPPLVDRIRRLDPSFEPTAQEATSSAGFSSPVSGLAAPGPSRMRVDLASQAGHPTPQHIDYAATLLRSVPPDLLETAHESYGARAIFYALLLGEDAAVSRAQFAVLDQYADPGVTRLTRQWAPRMAGVPSEAMLPLVDVLLPALGDLSLDQYRVFVDNVDRLIRCDDRISLFEWTLQRILRTHLRPRFENVPVPRIRYSSLSKVRHECRVMLSVLARASVSGEAGFARGASALGFDDLSILPPEECRLDRMDEALFALAEVTPPLKKRILEAAMALIAQDSTVTIEEAELLRATADTLGCPIPPLLPGRLPVAS